MTTPTPLSLRAYGLASSLASPLAPLFLAARARQGKEDPSRLVERLGRTEQARPPGALIWMHGASVGEGVSLLPLAWHVHAVRTDVGILITTGTRTSAEVLKGRLPPGAIHQFAPVDTPSAVSRFLDHWRPSLGVFVESELWPNLILRARASGARLALISARMSDASFRTWRSAPQAAKAILNAFDLVLPRDEAASARLSALGARVSGLADMKFGAEQLPDDLARRETLRSSIGDRCVILAASTHSGEESLILEAFSALGDVRECALLVIAPRRPDRGSVVTSAARGFGFATSRQGAGESPKGVAVYVADGLGELGLWYRLADLAVIGGSLVSGVGGHNPLEPARLGCAFIAGPFVENWPVYTSLRSCGATETAATAKALQTWFQGVIEASDRLNAMAARAGAWVADRDLEGEAALARVTALLPG